MKDVWTGLQNRNTIRTSSMGFNIVLCRRIATNVNIDVFINICTGKHVIVSSHTLIGALFDLVPPLWMRMRCGPSSAGRPLLQTFPINPVRPNIPPSPNKLSTRYDELIGVILDAQPHNFSTGGSAWHIR